MTIFTLNGIKRSAKTTTDILGRELERLGHKWVPLRYPVVRGWSGRSRTARRERALALYKAIKSYPGPRFLIAHSNGCAEACAVMDLAGTDIFQGVLFIAPAVNSDWTFPQEAFQRLVIVHNTHDKVLAAGSLLPGNHIWGGLGRKGYTGFHEGTGRIECVMDDKKRTFWSHSYYFQPPYIDWLVSISSRLVHNKIIKPVFGDLPPATLERPAA